MTQKIYIDAGCFIALAQEDLGVPDSPETEVRYTRKLLEAAKAGDIQVYTSLLTLTECLYVTDPARGGKLSNDEVKALFESLLVSGRSGVTPIEPSLFVIQEARDLAWVHGVNLKPMDSVHVASARFVRCDEMLTLDTKNLLTKTRVDALEQLGLRVRKPSQTVCLPDKYKQTELEELRDEGSEEP